MHSYRFSLPRFFSILVTLLSFSLLGAATHQVMDKDLKDPTYKKVLAIGDKTERYLWLNELIGHQAKKESIWDGIEDVFFTQKGSSPLFPKNEETNYYKDPKSKIIYITIPDWQSAQAVQKRCGFQDKSEEDFLNSFDAIAILLLYNYEAKKNAEKFGKDSEHHKRIVKNPLLFHFFYISDHYAENFSNYTKALTAFTSSYDLNYLDDPEIQDWTIRYKQNFHFLDFSVQKSTEKSRVRKHFLKEVKIKKQRKKWEPSLRKEEKSITIEHYKEDSFDKKFPEKNKEANNVLILGFYSISSIIGMRCNPSIEELVQGQIVKKFPIRDPRRYKFWQGQEKILYDYSYLTKEFSVDNTAKKTVRFFSEVSLYDYLMPSLQDYIVRGHAANWNYVEHSGRSFEFYLDKTLEEKRAFIREKKIGFKKIVIQISLGESGLTYGEVNHIRLSLHYFLGGKYDKLNGKVIVLLNQSPIKTQINNPKKWLESIFDGFPMSYQVVTNLSKYTGRYFIPEKNLLKDLQDNLWNKKIKSEDYFLNTDKINLTESKKETQENLYERDQEILDRMQKQEFFLKGKKDIAGIKCYDTLQRMASDGFLDQAFAKRFLNL